MLHGAVAIHEEEVVAEELVLEGVLALEAPVVGQRPPAERAGLGRLERLARRERRGLVGAVVSDAALPPDAPTGSRRRQIARSRDGARPQEAAQGERYDLDGYSARGAIVRSSARGT